MMKLTVALLLLALFFAARPRDGLLLRRYIGFALAGAGALLWSGIFDALGGTRSVATDAILYRDVLRLSALGLLSSMSGLIVAFWCPQRTLKIATIVIGAVSATLCATNVLVPY
jgi:hypothetical protein